MKNMSKFLLVPALGFLAMAQASRADPSFECSMTAGSQVEIGNCLTAVEANVDMAIEAALGFAKTSAADLDATTGRPEGVAALEAAQAAWVAYRDSQCDYVATTWGGGSGTGIAVQSCRVELGRARVDELMALVR